MADEIIKICKIHGSLVKKEIIFTKKGHKKCKKCRRRDDENYLKNNLEKVREREANYRKNNREKIREGGRNFYHNNRGKERQKRRNFYHNNRGKVREQHLIYRKNNQEKIRKKQKKIRNANHDLINTIYIGGLLRSQGWDPKDFPEEFIDVYKYLIKLKRKLKEM